MKFTAGGFIALIILAYVIDRILDYAPTIAWRLASGLTNSISAPQIMGGVNGQAPNVVSGPLELLDSAEAGFTRSYADKISQGGNTISASLAGTQGATQGFFVGDQKNPGVLKGFTNFFINPNRGFARDE
jgi:hypothetical protein